MTLHRIAMIAALGCSCLGPAQLLGAVIVDNDDGAPAYVETGGWTTSGSTGYDGGTYRFASPGAASTATWTGNIAAAGDYEVFVWYVPGANRATSTRYDIVATDGPHTVYVNQTGGGYTWDSIGTFNFSAGDNSITLDAAGSSGGDVVLADAVRFGGTSGDDYSLDSTTEVTPGVYHMFYTSPAPRAIHVLEFDLANPAYTIDMGFAQGKRNYSSNEAVSQIASRYDTVGHNVVGAINASFSEPGLSILGMLGTGGNLIATRDDTWWDQQTYMLQQSGSGWAGSDLVSASMVARFADETEVLIDILDYPCSAGAVSLYTPNWDSSTRSTSQGVEVIVEDVNYPLRPNKELVGMITAVHTGAASLNNAIPADGFVLAACSGAEADILPHAVVGERLMVKFDMSPLDLVNMKTLCTGNAWMVKDGAPFHGGGPERHPRTVIAWSGTQHWFVTFDGRQPGYSVGASVEEMTEFLIDTLHVDNAINLDGGGSTTMVVDGSVVNCPSDGAVTPCTGTERALPNALLLVERDPTTSFPLTDDFPSAGRSLTWDDKFTFNPVVSFAPAAPGGDGYVMEMLNPAGDWESASVGDIGDANYITEASIYCEYRPDVTSHGLERVGIFARDDGSGNFDSVDLGGGNCYALTFDSNDGRVRAGKVVDGVLIDFLEATPLYLPTTAWRDLRIFCHNSTIRYYLNGGQIAEVSDTTHTHGRCGIGYHEYFDDNAYMHGVRVEGFKSYLLPFDWNDDGLLNNSDVGPFVFCLNQSGPNDPYFAGVCAQDDVDVDGDIDLVDFAQMQFWFGAGN